MSRPVRILPDFAGAYCFVIFVAFVLFAGKRALGDGDTLWHIKFGRLILDRGELITRDPFSHTVYGQPWTSHEWLAEVVMGAIHHAAGLPGVVIFYFLLAALSFWLLFRIALRCGAGEWLAIICTSVALVLSLSHLLARPHLFTWLLGLLTLLILLKGGNWLYLLPVLMIPWTNLHGGFALGLTLQGLFLTGSVLERLTSAQRPSWREIWEAHRKPVLVLTLSLLATGVNPFGYRLLLFPFEVSKGSFSTLISEWLAPSLQAFWYYRLYLLALIFLLFFFGPRVTWRNRLFLLFFVNASLVHARHISLAGIFLTPLLVELGRPCLERLPQRRPREPQAELPLSPVTGPAATLALAFLLIFLKAAGWQPWATWADRLIPLPERFSPAAVAYLETNPPPGKLLNNDEWGDYLIYAMDPPPKLFLDGRLDMYGEKVLEDYSKIVTLEKEADKLLESYEIGWVLFPPGHLTRYLQAKGWQAVFQDDQVSILTRQAPSRP
jgi:hypothetical protein